MPDPRVSVVVTCFNLGEFLSEAVDSVRGQTRQDFELLIVDDGSTQPSTLNVLKELEADGIRVIRTPNRGLSAARNAGISAGRSELICCLDADDRLLPEYLERSISVLEASPSVAFVSHWVRTFGDQEGEWRPERCDFPTLLDVNCVNGAALVRRSAVNAAGGYDESFTEGCEDWDFWITLTERGWPGVVVPEILFEYRRRPGSMSRTMLDRVGHPAMYERIVKKHAATFAHHLLPLLKRRHRDRAGTRKHLATLTCEAEGWLHPELCGLRDDVRMLEERLLVRAERADLESRLANTHSELERLATVAEDLRRELTDSKEALAVSEHSASELRAALDLRTQEQAELASALAREREALEAARIATEAASEAVWTLRHRVDSCEAEIAALRASWSWTLTKPLRSLYEILGGGQR